MTSPPQPDRLSITGRSTLPADCPDYGSVVGGLRDYSRPPKNKQSPYCHIEVEKIGKGLDVRTTVMLRNIPNRVTQAELKQSVDQYILGDYDFMYLRIGESSLLIFPHDTRADAC